MTSIEKKLKKEKQEMKNRYMDKILPVLILKVMYKSGEVFYYRTTKSQHFRNFYQDIEKTEWLWAVDNRANLTYYIMGDIVQI
jgi:hypothetical protein